MLFQFRLNLRTITVLSAFALASLFATLAVVAIFQQMRHAVSEETGSMAAASARVAADLIDVDLQERTNAMVGMAATVRETGWWKEPARLQTWLDMVRKTATGYGWLGMTDAAGKVTAGSDGLAVGAAVAHRDWFQGGLKGLYHGDLHEAVLLQNALPPLPNAEPWRFIEISLPIHDEAQQLVGVLGAHLSWPWLRERLETARSTLPPGGEFWMVGADNRPRLGPSTPSDQPLALESLKLARAGNSGWRMETWPDGHRYITGFAANAGKQSYPGFGWVTLVRARADLYPPAMRLQQQAIVVAAVLAVLLVTAAAWAASTLWLNPLRAFAARLAQLREGQQPPQLPRHAPQEFHALNRALLRLLSRLDQKEGAIRRALEDVQHSFQSVGSGIPGVLSTFRVTPDQKVQFTFVGESLQRYYGVTPEALKADARAWMRNVHPEDAAVIAATFRQRVDGGERSFTHPMRVTGDDGVQRTMQLIAVQRDQADARVFDTISLDITELTQARLDADLANRAKSDFLATMSHELRTPLNAILGFAQALECSLADPEQQRQARHVRETGETLTRILNDVLDVAKIEAGKFDLDPQRFELAQVFDSCASIFRALSISKGVAFVTHVPDQMPALIGDPVRLRQILHNVLSNAFKFTATGQVTLSLEIRQVEERAHGQRVAQVGIRIVDTGMGMTDEQVSRLFQRFEQASRSTANRFGGTGLGLAIVRTLIDKMNGQVKVRSRYGAGTEFDMLIPFEVAQGVAPAGADARGLLALPDAPLLVLVVDDFSVNRLVLRALLEKRGHTVIEGEDGVQAIEMVGLHQPDLVLMDVDMPNLDGLQATRRIRANEGPGQRTPIHAMTGKAFAEDIEQALQSGMDGHLSKPVQLPELVRVVKAAAASRRSADSRA